MNAFLATGLAFSGGAVERLGLTLVHSLWQLALVALLALVTVRAMRRSSAALRYGVLVAAMIASVAVPAATWVLLPALTSDLSPRRATSDPRNFNPEANLQIDPTRRIDRTPLPGDSSFAQLPPSVGVPDLPAVSASDSVVGDTRDTQRAVRSLWTRMRSALRPWFVCIVAGWSVGVVLCSVRPVLGWRTLRRLRRVGVSPAPDDVLAAARRVSKRLGLRRAVQVLRSSLARVPVVVGYLRPVVLLPVSLMTSIPTRQLEAILAHELAHVRRHDFAVNLLQTLVETLFFYHPATWWLSHRIRVEREHCCDDLAMSLIGNRVEYGRALLAVEELRGQSMFLALGAAGASLVDRIRRIAAVGSDRDAATFVDRWPAALFVVALICLVWVVTMHPTVAAENHAGKKMTATAPAGEEYQSATYLQKKLTAKIPDAAWGKARDGLRLALVVRDANNTEWNELPAATSVPSELKVRHGDEVRCQLIVENVSDRDIRFSAYTYSDVGRTVEVLDRAGGKADIQSIDDGLPVLPGQWRLQPGERFLLDMPPVCFVDQHRDRGVGYFATTGAGEYTLRCGYTFGDLSADAIQPKASKTEWTGLLTTAALKVTVSDGPVLESKPRQDPERGALPPAQNPGSRTFGLRFKLASDMVDEVRQILLGRPGFEAKPSANNQEIVVTAPPQVLNRIQTFIAVTDWPDNITRGSNFEYPRDTVTRAARSFFYACAIEDSDEAFSKLLSPAVLAELKGDTKSKQYEDYITGGAPDAEWEKQLRGDWPGKKDAIQRLVREWNRYPLKRLTEGGGVAIGFGAKYFCSVSFDGAPKDFYEVTIEPDRNRHGAGKESFLFSGLPPWRESDPKAAAADETSFQASAKIDPERHTIEFFRPPTAGALRQLVRLEGDWTVTVCWPGSMDKSAIAAFEGIHIKDVRGVELAEPGSVDAWLKDLTRPDTGLKDLTTLDLYQTQVSDAGLKELARPDSGLKSLTSLNLRGTQVTDVGLKELTRPDGGLKSLASLSLRGTQITGAGLRELARQDTGLKALASLDLGETKVTDADLKELARPDGGLKALASLDLYRTQVTDAGLKELARPDSGLQALVILHLNGTQITDAGLKELARPSGSLKTLAALDLIRTKITDAGLKELAQPDGGLPALAVLDLYGTQVTDAGIKQLARADSGVKRLKLLRLGSTRVTDAAAKELARPDSGLKALASLDLSDTRVTDAGLKELARPDSSVKGLTELSLWATQVTDAGLSELSRPDNGLKALTSLYLQHTKVTEAGLKELQQARPGLKIEH